MIPIPEQFCPEVAEIAVKAFQEVYEEAVGKYGVVNVNLVTEKSQRELEERWALRPVPGSDIEECF